LTAAERRRARVPAAAGARGGAAIHSTTVEMVSPNRWRHMAMDFDRLILDEAGGGLVRASH
jgi:hypothetical protein